MNSPEEDPAEGSRRHPRATESDSANSTWEDVERELSRPNSSSATSSQEANPTQPNYGEASSTIRSFDPSSPLVMVETAFLASAASLIWLVNFYFPTGPILRIFFPVPIALIYLRWGNRAAWMGALVSGLLLSVLMGPPRSLLYVMPFGIMGVLLGMLWRRKATWAVSVAIGAILGAFGFFFRVWLVSLLLDDDLWLYATNQVTELTEWIFVKLNILVQPSLSFIQAMIVAMVILNNIMYLFVVHLVAWFLFDRLSNPIPRPPKWVQVLMEYEE